MTREMKNKLEACFSPGESPEDCCGALSYMKENIGQVSFGDDSDMSDMIDIMIRALKLDVCNIKFVEFLIANGFDINYKLAGNNCLLLKYVEDVFSGSLPRFLTAFCNGRKLSAEEVGEMEKWIDEYREDYLEGGMKG